MFPVLKRSQLGGIDKKKNRLPIRAQHINATDMYYTYENVIILRFSIRIK